MNLYYLDERDQAHQSWVLFEPFKSRPKVARKTVLPPLMHTFFGLTSKPDGMTMKPEYLQICCKTCGRYSEDQVFKIGFREPANLRIKGDYTHTGDRIFVVSDKFLAVIRTAKVDGYETKSIGNTGWNALRVTRLFDCADGVLVPATPCCQECGRPDGAVGSVTCRSQIVSPLSDNSFFTTKVNHHRRLWDRDIFVGEQVVNALKNGGIKGGYCIRLWTAEEVQLAAEKAKQGKKWTPPGPTVLL